MAASNLTTHQSDKLSYVLSGQCLIFDETAKPVCVGKIADTYMILGKNEDEKKFFVAHIRFDTQDPIRLINDKLKKLALDIQDFSIKIIGGHTNDQGSAELGESLIGRLASIGIHRESLDLKSYHKKDSGDYFNGFIFDPSKNSLGSFGTPYTKIETMEEDYRTTVQIRAEDLSDDRLSAHFDAYKNAISEICEEEKNELGLSRNEIAERVSTKADELAGSNKKTLEHMQLAKVIVEEEVSEELGKYLHSLERQLRVMNEYFPESEKPFYVTVLSQNG